MWTCPLDGLNLKVVTGTEVGDVVKDAPIHVHEDFSGTAAACPNAHTWTISGQLLVERKG